MYWDIWRWCAVISRGGGGGWGEDRDSGGCRCSSVSTTALWSNGSWEEVRPQPSDYSLECKRGQSSFSPRKGISFPLPIAAETDRGGWETLNKTAEQQPQDGEPASSPRHAQEQLKTQWEKDIALGALKTCPLPPVTFPYHRMVLHYQGKLVTERPPTNNTSLNQSDTTVILEAQREYIRENKYLRYSTVSWKHKRKYPTYQSAGLSRAKQHLHTSNVQTEKQSIKYHEQSRQLGSTEGKWSL